MNETFDRHDEAGLDTRDYPQLRLLCWDWSETHRMTRREAFARYERLWRHVDTAALGPGEATLIQALTEEFGNGLFNA